MTSLQWWGTTMLLALAAATMFACDKRQAEAADHSWALPMPQVLNYDIEQVENDDDICFRVVEFNGEEHRSDWSCFPK